MLLNGDVLNISVKTIKDLLGLDPDPDAKYTDKTITCRLINACTSQTSVNYVSNNLLMILQKEPLYTGFVILIWMKFSMLLIRS